MSGKQVFRLFAFGLAVFCCCSAALAAPWDKLLTRQNVEADASKSYELTEENGPWLILACTFSGDQAEQEANELALELRKKYKLPAYVYKKRFDLGDEAEGRGVDEFGAPVKMRYKRGDEIEEVAVLVGDYPTIDHSDAQKTLQELKTKIRPVCLKASREDPTSRNLASWRTLLLLKEENRQKGPLAHAFLTTNPLLPEDYFDAPTVDEFVVRLNQDSAYSLLKCPGKYTVQVAHFTGRVIIDQAKIQEVERTGRMDGDGNKLAEAGVKAERMAELLRAQGEEAYTFHDRYSSIVTIGSFNSVGTPRADGRIEIDPRVHKIMETYKARPVAPGAERPGHLPQQVQSVEGIPFDIQPIPVLVPKVSVSAAYSPGNRLLR